MNRRVWLVGVAALVLALGAVPALAQIPDKFTNLKVLPKDIDKRQMVDIMRNSRGLSGCVATSATSVRAPPRSKDTIFASDEKEHKNTTRAMMQMVGEINDRLLPAAGMKSPMQVRCITCHRGVTEPETLDDVLLEEVGKGGTRVSQPMERWGFRPVRHSHGRRAVARPVTSTATTPATMMPAAAGSLPARLLRLA